MEALKSASEKAGLVGLTKRSKGKQAYCLPRMAKGVTKIEQLNIEGKRSGNGFVCHRATLIEALTRAQLPKVELIGVNVGRTGLISYLKTLAGSNIVKIIPAGGSASENTRATEKRLKVICGSSTGYLTEGTWVTEKLKSFGACQLKVTSASPITPNLGSSELSQAIARVIPFAEKGESARPVLRCLSITGKDGNLVLAGSDGYKLAEVTLPCEVSDGSLLVDASELTGLIPILRKAKRTRLSLETDSNPDGKATAKALLIETELIRYRFLAQSGTYPDYEKVIPTSFEAEARFDSQELLRASQGLATLNEAADSAVILSTIESGITLETKDGSGQVQIQAEISGRGRVGLNPRFLSQALKAVGGMVEVKLGSATSPVLLSAPDYRIILMPVQIAESRAIIEAETVVRQAEAKVTVPASYSEADQSAKTSQAAPVKSKASPGTQKQMAKPTRPAKELAKVA